LMVRSRHFQEDCSIVVYHSLTEEEFSDVQSGTFDRDLHTICPLRLCALSHRSKSLLLSMFSFPVSILLCLNEVSSFPPSFQRGKSKTLQSVTIFQFL